MPQMAPTMWIFFLLLTFLSLCMAFMMIFSSKQNKQTSTLAVSYPLKMKNWLW